MPYVIDDYYKSENFNSRIQCLVLHYTAENFEKSLKSLTTGSVSSHYLVPEGSMDDKREVFRLVRENLRAWHAGESAWQNRENLNDSSIGIEIVNLGYVDKEGKRIWFPFEGYQVETVIELSKDIVDRYQIEPTRVVGHGDIAPGRKVDPGPLFPWKRLYDHGVGAWYDQEDKVAAEAKFTQNNIDILWVQKSLKIYGYSIKATGKLDNQTKQVVTAFQMHFRPSDFSGNPDSETCAILQALVEKYYPQVVLDQHQQRSKESELTEQSQCAQSSLFSGMSATSRNQKNESVPEKKDVSDCEFLARKESPKLPSSIPTSGVGASENPVGLFSKSSSQSERRRNAPTALEEKQGGARKETCSIS